MALVSIFLFFVFLLTLVGLLLLALRFWNTHHTPTAVQVDVPIDKLPAVLEGFSIAHISVLRVGTANKTRYLQNLVDSVNRLNADVVVIGGSLFSGNTQELQAHAAPLAQLRSTHGTFLVNDHHEWTPPLQKLGVQVLVNEHAVIHHNTDSQDPERAVMVVAGVSDEHLDPHATLADAPALTLFRLLLAHPRRAPQATIPGFELQLSGDFHWLRPSKITHLRLVMAP